MIWALLIFMAVATFLGVFYSLTKKNIHNMDGNNGVLAIYRSQLDEIEGEAERGLITPKEAKGARLEVERRLVRAYKKSEKTKISSGIILPLLVLGLLLIGAGYFYLETGNPDLTKNIINDREVTLEEGASEIEDILGKLEDHIKENPDDLEAWVLMANSRIKQGKYYEAATAFGRAYDLSENDVELLVQQGEALVNLSGGLMTPASNLVFGTAMKLNPNHPAPKYYLGLGRYQNGNIEGALNIWEELLSVSKEEAPWRPNLKNQIAKAKNELEGTPSIGVENMSPLEQEAFIENMISSLREKLSQNPNDLEGWLQLARSEAVRGRVELALIALQKAEILADGDLKERIGQEILKLKNEQNE